MLTEARGTAAPLRTDLKIVKLIFSHYNSRLLETLGGRVFRGATSQQNHIQMTKGTGVKQTYNEQAALVPHYN